MAASAEKKRFVCMGIESTAHTFGVGIVGSDGKILADARDMFRPGPGKGMVPRDLSEHHTMIAPSIIATALNGAGLEMDDVDVIAFSQGPGLPPCLNVGAALARYISIVHNIPLVGVNHPVAHIEIGKLTAGPTDPVILYLSGGNTQIIAYAEGRYRIFGETLDVAVGNAFDVVARMLGLRSPGGPEIERLAKGGSYIEAPYVVKGMDMSFSGFVTDAKRKVTEGVTPADICFSMQETCFAMLTEVTERALAHTNKTEALLVGGVAANKRMQEMLRTMCEERGARMEVVDSKYSGDCGAMIAWAGALAYKSGQKTSLRNSVILPKWRTDEIEVTWLR
ncbi:MAG: KEOPS complex N(6)-L-threonylcarbamoyladenine synthase Kae1 [Candidatus Aenigmarchaeota archaeon]|nr:KEOPS complex N(6)-L-threonylcarbamoyladenine synthase Kae1 [Candidatus Aenigmarchaeota archaeon]